MTEAVYITGGASGIGRELACRYVRDGRSVFLFDLSPLEAVVDELRGLITDATAQRVEGFSLDVADDEAVRQTFSKAAAHAAPELVVNSAGILLCEPFTSTTREAFERVISVNLLGSRNVAEAAVEHLRPGGHLALVASLAGVAPCYGYSAYCAAKHGVVGLADVLRMELKPEGFDVSVVCPPEVETPMVVEERKTRPKATTDIKGLGGLLTVQEAAEQIQAGLARRNFMIIPGRRARFMYGMTRLTPRALSNQLSDFLVAKGRD